MSAAKSRGQGGRSRGRQDSRSRGNGGGGRRRKSGGGLLRWWPVLAGIVIAWFAVRFVNELALLGRPWQARLVAPWAFLLEGRGLGLPTNWADHIYEVLLYAQFPVYGLLLVLLEKRLHWGTALGHCWCCMDWRMVPCSCFSRHSRAGAGGSGKTGGWGCMSTGEVKIVECPRDAWQGLPQVIPTEIKADYLRSLVRAGFRHIDAVSFVSPQAVPQMADSEQVMEELAAEDANLEDWRSSASW